MVQFIFFIFFVLLPVAASSDVAIEFNTADIDRALALIAARSPDVETRQCLVSTCTNEPSRLKLTENGNAFFSNIAEGPAAMEVLSSFRMKSPSIEKHIKLGGKSRNDEYAFMIELLSRKTFRSTTRSLPGGDVLIFDDGNDMFLYTQSNDGHGHVDLKEWVYARKPNSRYGSHYRWYFRPELWGWPLTVEYEGNNQFALYRNMPVYGVPMTNPQRREHVAKTVQIVMVNALGAGRFYFPFHDKIADMPAPVGWTNEGIERQAEMRITDEPMQFHKYDPMAQIHPPKNLSKKKKNKKRNAKDEPWTGPDWSFRTSRQQNIFDTYFKAKADEYPLLIDPTLVF